MTGRRISGRPKASARLPWWTGHRSRSAAKVGYGSRTAPEPVDASKAAKGSYASSSFASWFRSFTRLPASRIGSGQTSVARVGVRWVGLEDDGATAPLAHAEE